MISKKRPQQLNAKHASKLGRRPTVVTTKQRHLVELAVAIGMTVDQISTAIEMPRRTLYRAFKTEIAAGRAKRASAARLDAMAEAGNVSAAKYLHSLMLERGQRQDAADANDPWAAVAAEIENSGDGVGDLAQFQDFGKAN
jgi:pentatricopeptide repeat protein